MPIPYSNIPWLFINGEASPRKAVFHYINNPRESYPDLGVYL